MNDEKINVLHATLHLNMGGLEAVIMDLCRRGNKDKFQYFVLCFNSCDSVYRQELQKYGVKVFFIQRKSRYDVSFFLKIINILKENTIHVLHAHSGCVFNALICSFFARVPVRLFTEHGLPFFSDGKPMPATTKTRIEEYIIGKLSKKIVGVSHEIEENLRQRFPHQKHKISMLANGIDTSMFTERKDTQELDAFKRKYLVPRGKLIIGSVGRLVPIKNYSCLLKAFALLQKNNTIKNKAHIVLVGDGEEKNDLETLAKKLGIFKDTSFLGQQYGIHEILPLFDVFVLPSFTEGTSISLLEAQSCAVPAVVTDVGGNPNIIQDHKNGFLFSEDDSTALAEKLGVLLGNEDLARELGQRAREKVIQKFGVTAMVTAYQNMYIDTLSNFNQSAFLFQ